MKKPPRISKEQAVKLLNDLPNEFNRDQAKAVFGNNENWVVAILILRESGKIKIHPQTGRFIKL